MPQITSLQNDTIKLIRSLGQRKTRRQTGLFVAGGTAVLAMAEAAGDRPEMLVAGPDATGAEEFAIIRWAEKAGARVVGVSAPVLAKIAGRDNPQSLIGVFRRRAAAPPDPKAAHPGDLWIALEEVRDPGNLGTIIRTADAVGASGVVLIGRSCDPSSPECVAATMGSIFSVPVAPLEQDAFLALARAWPGDVAALIVGATEDIRRARLREPVLLLMGREGPGLGAELAAAATRRLAIPMAGRAQSLNLAVATAIAAYQVRARHLSV
jgi:TrmH family RNA methyltransferase